MRVGNEGGTRWATWGLSLHIVISGACTGSGDGASSGSGVSSSKAGADLTDEDAMKLCAWLTDLLRASEATDEQRCTVDALASADTEQECTDLVDECLALVGQTQGGTTAETCAMATKEDFGFSSTCTATIREIEVCYRDFFKGLEDERQSASCAEAEDYQGTAFPPSCDLMCPGLFRERGAN